MGPRGNPGFSFGFGWDKVGSCRNSPLGVGLEQWNSTRDLVVYSESGVWNECDLDAHYPRGLVNCVRADSSMNPDSAHFTADIFYYWVLCMSLTWLFTVQVFIENLLYTSYYSKCFKNINEFNPHTNTLRSIIIPFYRWGNWGIKRFCDASQVPQWLSTIWTQEFYTEAHALTTLLH